MSCRPCIFVKISTSPEQIAMDLFKERLAYHRVRRIGARFGYTTFELIIVLAMIAVLALTLYPGTGSMRVSKGNFEAMSRVMENIADATEDFVERNGTAPANLAATGYTPPPHPFGGAYGIQVSVPDRWVKVTSTVPAGRGRALGPAARVTAINAKWDQAEIVRPFSTEGIWYDKKDLYGE
jgi:type II secretory pathway pseudopilin PulG